MNGNRLFQKDRQGKTGGVSLFVKGNFWCIEVNHSNCASLAECLGSRSEKSSSRGLFQ